MKILSITAGAANMYCGTCFTDNALAAALKAQGHDVILLPLYTPTLTDEANVSHPRIFFGGISVYLEQRFPLFRKTPRFLDRLWDAPAMIKTFSGRGISVSPRLLGDLTVSMLQGEHGSLGKELAKLLEWLRAEPAPDVVSLPYTLLIALARPLREALGRPVCCTLQGEDLFLENLVEPYRSRALGLIRTQVGEVDAFLAVSEYYARHMSSYLGIPESRMRVVPLGINLEGHHPRPRPAGRPFRIGYFARIAPEKGLHLLAEAYRLLRRRESVPPSTLEVAGYLAPEYRGYLAEVEQRMREWGLAGEFHYHGTLDRDRKIAFLQSLDVLSVPCTCDEPKGISVLEAMANGVPVVQPRRGSFIEMVAKAGGGLLVEPDDASSLADGIQTLWQDTALAERLGRAGHDGVRRHYGISRMAADTLEVYRGLLERVPA